MGRLFHPGRELWGPHGRLLLLPVELPWSYSLLGGAARGGQLDRSGEHRGAAPPPLGLPSGICRQGPVRFFPSQFQLLRLFHPGRELWGPRRRLLLLPVELPWSSSLLGGAAQAGQLDRSGEHRGATSPPLGLPSGICRQGPVRRFRSQFQLLRLFHPGRELWGPRSRLLLLPVELPWSYSLLGGAARGGQLDRSLEQQWGSSPLASLMATAVSMYS